MAHSTGGCPVYPGVGKGLSWSIPDISKLEGTHEEKLQQAFEGRIKSKIDQFVVELEEKTLENGLKINT